MKKTKVVLLLVLMIACGLLSFLPLEAQANAVKKMPGWWIGKYCVCPIWWMSDCDCIVPEI